MPIPNLYPYIQAAQQRLQGQAHLTPILTSTTLNKRVGAEIFLKCENLQRMGAFKFRGAFNAISQLSLSEQKRGIVTFSSGNHAQAVALVCRGLGLPATIVMPNNAPAAKIAATRGYGAEILLYDPAESDRESLARRLQAERGLTLIPPFDHERIIAGQGTAAMELFDQVGDLDMLLVPCGGGGLLSGSAIAAKNRQPGCHVVGIEPKLGDDAVRSFYAKTLQTVHNPPTIADGTRTPSLGKLTFPIILKYADDMVAVSEEGIAEAVRFLFTRLKIVVEPSGALGVAALLSGELPASGKVGVILSGGNIDPAVMRQILAGEL